MAVKTMAKDSGTGQYNAGWHELTISEATDGEWNGKRTIDLSFEGYHESMSHRIFETVNKTTNEEFKIANLFRHACAGIIDVLNDPTGKKPVIQYDDEVSNLVGTRINALFFKETNSTTGKEYSKIFDIVPVAQVTDHITWTEDDVSRLKSKAESRYKKNNSPSNVDLGTVNIDTTTTSTNDEIPF
tara:strand:+ start:106 stop:663 length:558 start_codon:yes stop_codon:yes gene_type:complete